MLRGQSLHMHAIASQPTHQFCDHLLAGPVALNEDLDGIVLFQISRSNDIRQPQAQIPDMLQVLIDPGNSLLHYKGL